MQLTSHVKLFGSIFAGDISYFLLLRPGRKPLLNSVVKVRILVRY